MAITNNADKIILQEGQLQRAEVQDILNIGVTGSVMSHFTNIETLGYFESGSTVVGLTRTYAESKSQTPRVMVRKDLVEKLYTITANSLQILSPDLWELRDGLELQDYAGGSGNEKIGWIGASEPVQSGQVFILEAFDQLGNPYNYVMFNGQVFSEDISETRTGENHPSIPVVLTAFPHSAFDLSIPAQKQRSYGFKLHDLS